MSTLSVHRLMSCDWLSFLHITQFIIRDVTAMHCDITVGLQPCSMLCL